MDLVKIQWKDACGRAGWIQPEDVDQEDLSPILVTSVGWLVKETDAYLTLSHSLSEVGHVNGYITIPKGWIKNRKKIKL